MKYIIERNVLEFLWTALDSPARAGSTLRARPTFEKIVKLGWATVYDFEELFRWLEPKLDLEEFDAYSVSTSLGVRWERFTYRSWAGQKSFRWQNGMRANEVALFLVRLEQIGFSCDATYLVDLLKPALATRGKKAFSESELAINRFEKERHRHGELYLLAERKANLPLDVKVAGRITTRSGYQLAMKQNAEGEMACIQIASPKQPPGQAAAEQVLCSKCGTVWERSDPDSAYAHRLAHRSMMRYLDPQPSKHYLKAAQSGQNAGVVTHDSPLWKHREMHRRALAFKREMHYDWCQWAAPGQAQDVDAVGYLIADEQGAIVGAYCFRERSRGHKSRIWTLDWVWIAPKYRRKGYLARQWKALREIYGDFAIESPVSDEMRLFIKSQGDQKLLSL